MKRFLTALWCILSLCVSLSTHAEIVDAYQFHDTATRTRAMELARSLRCPQCQNQNLLESNSPVAAELRLEVYKMADEGKTDAQIVDLMTARFGDFVNYKPPFQWNTALLWLLPVVLLILAFALIYQSRRKASCLPLMWEGGAKRRKNATIDSPPSAFGSVPRKQGEPSTSPYPQEKQCIRLYPMAFNKNGLKLYTIIFVLLIALPLAYYFSLGRFEYVQQGEQAMIAQHNQRVAKNETDQNEDLIEKIQNKLRADPNNADNWTQLGEAYAQNNEFDHALIAYSNAEKLVGSKPNILGLAATALYYQAGQRITPKVEQLLDQALAQDHNEVSSLSLLVTIAMQQRDYAQAGNYLQQLLDAGNSAVDRRSVIQRMKMLEFLQRGEKGENP